MPSKQSAHFLGDGGRFVTDRDTTVIYRKMNEESL